jgi:hypothetical protein
VAVVLVVALLVVVDCIEGDYGAVLSGSRSTIITCPTIPSMN